MLYLIEILHQTTTPRIFLSFFKCCILSKFYIKPQLGRCIRFSWRRCILSKFYIKPQQRIRHKIGHSCCILSKFYIKPQQFRAVEDELNVVSYRNSTSNHNIRGGMSRAASVVSYRNSTSNHNNGFAIKLATPVVSYRNSTSNHNHPKIGSEPRLVVSYRNSTSNHNLMSAQAFMMKLYLIEILHQTTTAHSS